MSEYDDKYYGDFDMSRHDDPQLPQRKKFSVWEELNASPPYIFFVLFWLWVGSVFAPF